MFTFYKRFKCYLKGHIPYLEIQGDKPTVIICGRCDYPLGELNAT